MFGSIKPNSGAIALLVRFIWVSVNAAIRTMVRAETAKKMGLGPLPNELWCDCSVSAVRLSKCERCHPNHGAGRDR